MGGSAKEGWLRVLGIDPGSRLTGYGIVEQEGRVLRALAHGVARPAPGDPAARLASLVAGIEQVVEEWQPEVIALECAFVGKSMSSALRLGEVRGAFLAFAGGRGLPVFDYPPATVKLTVAGVGNATKAVVANAVAGTLGGSHDPGDAADALAVALCHLQQASFRSRVVEVGPRRGRIQRVAVRAPAGARFVRVSR
jgi:crossover junction endodeoxyribonuclease RuvC